MKMKAKLVFWIGLAVLVAIVIYHLNWDLVRALEFSTVWEYREVMVWALGMSLMIALIATAIGLVVGTLLAIVSQSSLPILRWIVVIYVEIFRNTPILVMLIWVHFALPILTGFTTTALQSGLIAMALQSSAYFSEIVRAGVGAVPRGQWEAALALGLPLRPRWTEIVLPQALRIIIPPLANLGISLFKATSILSILSISELMTVSTRISNFTFKPIEVLTVAACMYFIVGYLMSRGTLRLERHLREGER